MSANTTPPGEPGIGSSNSAAASAWQELLELHTAPAWWVSPAGDVLHANKAAMTLTEIRPGASLPHAALRLGVQRAVARNEALTAEARIGGARRSWRVIPVETRRFAVVLAMNADTEAQELGAGELMRTLRAGMRDPLREVHAALDVAEASGSFSLEMAVLADKIRTLLDATERMIELAMLWESQDWITDERVELEGLVQASWAHVEHLARAKGVQLAWRRDPSNPTGVALYGSWRWLKRLLAEVLELAVADTEPCRVLEVEHRQRGSRAQLVVWSQSSRASEDARPEGRVARDRLGRRLCQHIVKLHGGSMTSLEDAGHRTVLIELPTGAPAGADHAQPDPEQANRCMQDLAHLMSRRPGDVSAVELPEHEARPVILVVEDDPDIRRLIQMALEPLGALLHVAVDGASGVALAREVSPDLILMDVMMPGPVDGLQACREITREPRFRDVPVLLLTARNRPSDREAGLKAGATAYLVKPFSPLELAQTVAQGLRHRRPPA